MNVLNAINIGLTVKPIHGNHVFGSSLVHVCRLCVDWNTDCIRIFFYREGGLILLNPYSVWMQYSSCF